MKETRRITHVKQRLVIGAVLLAASVIATQAMALDSRTEYLIDLLENSGNFRSRVQAVETLGQIASTTTDDEEKALILKTLKAAAIDKNESVRLMVAASLGIIGDPSALPALEKLASDEAKAVKKQAKSSIDKIEKKQEAGGDASALLGLDDQEPSKNLPLTFYVGIGTWSDKKADEFADLEPKTFIKKSLRKLLSKNSSVKVAADSASTSKVKSAAKKKKLTPYVLTGSVSHIDLDEKDNKATAKLQMVVLTGDGNMAMMLSATGAASVESKGKMNAARRKDLVNSALLSAIMGLTGSLDDHFEKEIEANSKKKKKKKSWKKKKKKGK
jgi:hypothetical protein